MGGQFLKQYIVNSYLLRVRADAGSLWETSTPYVDWYEIVNYDVAS